MQQRTALITGSTSGIGLAIAKAFAQQGYNLIFNGLETDGGKTAAAVADQYQINYLFDPANMLHPDALRTLVIRAEQRFGTIDVLINNAGVQHVSPVEEFPDDKWNVILGVNLTSAFHLTKAVWPAMKKQQFGRIINIASAHGLVASEYKSAYVAAKHGLVGFTKTIALEGAPYGITANAVCPGYVRTALVDKQIADQALTHQISESEVAEKIMLAKQSIKQFIPTETIAAMCLFLASEQAATLTGAALPIDGGWSAQ